MSFLATSGSVIAGADPTALIQFGILGIIVALILFGWLWAKPSVDRIIRDKERAEEQRDQMIDIYQKQVIPVLNDVQDKLIPMLTTVQYELRDLNRRNNG